MRFRFYNSGTSSRTATIYEVQAVSSSLTIPTYFMDLSQWDNNFKINGFASPYPITIGNNVNGDPQLNITLFQKPTVNMWNFAFTYANLTFYYQPPLTQEFNEADCNVWTETYVKLKTGQEFWRSENIVGSYAVYSTTKRDNQYKTGKLFHIYRPLLIDAKGKTSWASLNITKNALTITVNQTFLASATYPVTVDPSFGKTSIGGTERATNTGNKFSCIANLPVTATVTTINIYCSCNAIYHVKFAIYSSKAGPLPNALQWADNTGTAGLGNNKWVSESGLSISLSAANYWLSWNTDSGDFSGFWDSLGSTCHAYKAHTYVDNWEDPFGVPDGTADRLYSIYCNYTTGQDLTFQLSQTIHATSSLVQQKELSKLLSETVKLTSSTAMLKEKGFRLTEIAYLTSSIVQQKELGFSLSQIISLTSSYYLSKEKSISLLETSHLTSSFYEGKEKGISLSEIVALTSSLYMGKEKGYSLPQTIALTSLSSMQKELLIGFEVSFGLSETAHYTSFLSMLKEIKLTIVEIVETMTVNGPMTFTIEQIAAAVDYGLIALVVAVLAIALTLALTIPNRKDEEEE
jgi:hypothetical protein